MEDFKKNTLIIELGFAMMIFANSVNELVQDEKDLSIEEAMALKSFLEQGKDLCDDIVSNRGKKDGGRK